MKMIMEIAPFIASGMFVSGSFVKGVNKMRMFFLIGAVIFAIVFAMAGLNNSNNIANFSLNVLNIVLHTYHLIHDNKKGLELFSKSSYNKSISKQQKKLA